MSYMAHKQKKNIMLKKLEEQSIVKGAKLPIYLRYHWFND